MFIDRFDERRARMIKKNYYKEPELGVIFNDDKIIFRIFLRNAEKVFIAIYDSPEKNLSNEFELKNIGGDIWEFETSENLTGKFYGYKFIREGKLTDKVHLDPYAKAVTSFNDYMSPRLGIILNEEFDWEGDEWIKRDWRDLIIYEMHVRDVTKHPSAGAEKPGTYAGLVEENITGGIDYVNSLGVNAVELLPVQEFANVEIPYKKRFAGRFNDWNQHERNHWGYMTSAYFAPAAFYAEGGELKWNEWTGKNAAAVNEMKKMVKAFHRKDIAVIMDVVYNHFSEYEFANIKELDEDYYFRKDESGNFISESFCGNDLRSESPFVRKLIIDSILFWMLEYHIDGFRFDLGNILDWQTIDEIICEARKINPHVIFICEPWGGGYDPKGFSLRGWGSWNDQIRNGVKGENPFDGKGWIFGEFYGNNNPDRIKSYVRGTLIKDRFGLFQKAEHSVNYLESHDGYTLGDFIRIASGRDHLTKIEDLDEHTKLNPEQIKLNKLAAIFLLISKGIVMIHAGQEFARTKVIFKNEKIQDERAGLIDHNSYEKDDETNYINYERSKINKDLSDYYKGLIAIRNEFEALRYADYHDYKFYDDQDNPFALAVEIKYKNENLFIAFNTSHQSETLINLPEGNWKILADQNYAGLDRNICIENEIKLHSKNGMILIKE